MILQLEYTRYDETTSGKEKIVDLTDGLANHTHSVNIDDIPGLSAQLAGMTGGLVYKGTWDPSTGMLPLGGAGWYYVVNGSGNVGGTEYNTKDMILWNGTSFDKIDNTDSVVSVNGQTGVVTLTIPSGDYNDLTNKPDLSGLHSHNNNIDLYPDPTGATTGYVLKKTGAGLAFQPDDTFSGDYNELSNKPDIIGLENDVDGIAADIVNINANKLDASRFTGTEIQAKLGNANLHALSTTEYSHISAIPDKISGSGTVSQIPVFTGTKEISGFFQPVGTISEGRTETDIIPLEGAIIEYVNNRIASNATGENDRKYRKANVMAIADYEAAPPTTNEGDRYILAKDNGTFSTGSLHAGWGSGTVSPGDVVYYEDGWKKESETSPVEGWTIFVDALDKFAVFCVGTSTQWSIGSVGQPVDVASEDTSRNKLVSDKMMHDLNDHMVSTHADKISAIVNQAYIEANLTGPVSSHSHAASGVSLQSETLIGLEIGETRAITIGLPILAIVESVFLLEEV